MRLNPNHEQDGKEAWEKSGLTYGQEVVFQGKTYKAVAIGYGMIFNGRVRISDGVDTLVVDVSDVAKKGN